MDFVESGVCSARENPALDLGAVGDFAAQAAVAVHVGPGIPGGGHRRVDGMYPAAGPKGNVVVGVLAKEFKSIVVLARKHACGQSL